MIVGLMDNEYPSGSSMSASVIICSAWGNTKIEPTLFGFSPDIAGRCECCNIRRVYLPSPACARTHPVANQAMDPKIVTKRVREPALKSTSNFKNAEVRLMFRPLSLRRNRTHCFK